MSKDIETPHTLEIHGIKTMTPDSKGRIAIPTEWHDTLGPNTPIIILNTGNYLLVIPKQHYQQIDSDLIAIEEKIDGSGRLLIGKGIQESFALKVEQFAGMIGKGNHIEVYLDPNNFQETIERSKRAAVTFQAKLIGILK